MMELTATAESADQAKALIDLGVDTVYIGNDEFGLRMPASLSPELRKASGAQKSWKA